MLQLPLVYETTWPFLCVCALCCVVMRRTGRVFLTMSLLCYSSASEDLGCRRGDFSRKHYGSVELVSPTHNLSLICLCLTVSASSCFFFCSSWSPRLLWLFLLFSLGMDGRQREEGGGLMSHDVLGVVQWCAPVPVGSRCGCSTHSRWWCRASPAACFSLPKFICFVLTLHSVCVSLWLITKLLSHCSSGRGGGGGGGDGGSVCECASLHCELSLCLPIAQSDRKS